VAHLCYAGKNGYVTLSCPGAGADRMSTIEKPLSAHLAALFRQAGSAKHGPKLERALAARPAPPAKRASGASGKRRRVPPAAVVIDVVDEPRAPPPKRARRAAVAAAPRAAPPLLVHAVQAAVEVPARFFAACGACDGSAAVPAQAVCGATEAAAAAPARVRTRAAAAAAEQQVTYCDPPRLRLRQDLSHERAVPRRLPAVVVNARCSSLR
jgi:hypothetical protein